MNESSSPYVSLDMRPQRSFSIEGGGRQQHPVSTQNRRQQINVPHPLQIDPSIPAFLLQKCQDWENSQQEYSFNTKILITSLIYYILYYYLLGWLLLVLKCFFKILSFCLPNQLSACFSRQFSCCLSKWPLIHNLSLRSYEPEKWVWVNTFAFPLWFFFSNEEVYDLIPLVIAVGINNIFVIVSRVFVVSYTNKNTSKLITETILEPEEMILLKKMEFFDQEAELRDTFNRLKINISRYYFSYLQEPETLSRRMKRTIINTQNTFLTDEEIRHMSSETTNSFHEVMNLERRIFEKKYFSNPTHLDNCKPFGYNFAGELLSQTKEFIPCFLKILFLAFYCTSNVAVVRWCGLMDGFVLKKSVGFLLLFEFYFSCFIFNIVYIVYLIEIGILNLQRRRKFMLKLGELIIPENPQSLNVFDDMSLRTWMRLRKMCMHYGDREMEIIGVTLTSFMVLHILASLVLLAKYYWSFKIEGYDWLYFIELFNTGMIFSLVFLIIMIMLALSINAQFPVHQELIRKNQSDVEEMFRLYPYYVEQELKPVDKFEVQAVRLLNQEFGTNYDQLKLDHRLEMLMNTYRRILEGLASEEKYHPIKFVGIRITLELVIAIVAPIISAFGGMIISFFKSK